MLKTLKIDDKWSVEYNITNNDSPVNVLRHGEKHPVGVSNWNNDSVAMFYALLAHEQGDWNIEEYKIWKGISPRKPCWASLGFACYTWSDANDLLQYMNQNNPASILRVVKRKD